MTLARARMAFAPVLLSDAAQRTVARVIVEHCRFRGWESYESAVRTNHVHVVVAYAGLKPEPMMAQFKGYATRALRVAGIVLPCAPVWAEGGSTGYLWSAQQVNGACAYVREGQGLPE
jgi:hypothetical protein